MILISILLLFLTVLLLANIYYRIKGKNGYGGKTTTTELISTYNKDFLAGKVAIITGANTGIGKETARSLLKLGAKVIIACRDQKKALESKKELEQDTNREVISIPLDLGSFESIKSFVAEFEKLNLPLDILINNAGVMFTPYWKTKDGFESQMGINHLGHFKLTNLLLDHLKKSKEGRIITVSSSAHRLATKLDFEDLFMTKEYKSYAQYSQSKVANIMFAKHLAKLVKDTNIKSVSLHPGAIITELQENMGFFAYWAFYLFISLTGRQKNVLQGASTTVFCAIHPSVKNGEYYEDCNECAPLKYALDEKDQEKLWDLSEKLTK